MPVTTAAATARALGLWALSVGLAAAAPHKERKEPFAKEMGQAKGKIGEVTGSVTAFLTNTTVAPAPQSPLLLANARRWKRAGTELPQQNSTAHTGAERRGDHKAS